MAERRMISKTVIDTDLFLDMPPTSQLLYFHLELRADDEGFVLNPKTIQRMVGASNDDFSILIAKNFIIPFESGVVVITHWLVHNSVRKDRIKETSCSKEKAMLHVNNDRVYLIEQDATKRQPNDNQMTTKCQHRLGKDRLGEDRIGKDRIDNTPKGEMINKPKVDYQKIVAYWNDTCVELPKVQKLTKSRKQAIRLRVREFGEPEILRAIKETADSDFLCGKVTNFSASFDWVLKPSNLPKVLEGNYQNKQQQTKGSQPFEEERDAAYDEFGEEWVRSITNNG